MTQSDSLSAFITKWAASGAAERANAQAFLIELCQLLEVESPQPKRPDEAANAYVFEKAIPTATGSTNFIDCYKRGCFVLETKQGADRSTEEVLSAEGKARAQKRKSGHGTRGTRAWDIAMEKARKQAEAYARNLPAEEIPGGRPPFLLVVDVGHSFALYTDWSRAGGHYVPFPDPASYRFRLEDLKREDIRARLQAVWTDPLSLDPSRRSAKVTREIADRLARLARSLEGHHEAEAVAQFLMRCLFTMFAEDVGLLPDRSFRELLEDLKRSPDTFAPMLQSLWQSMNTGGFSPIIRQAIPRFNGGLFASSEAIPLNADQIQLLIEAAAADWRDVEPAIFGTLLERALNPRERHKLGAHYTPRAYVERLVQPTVIQPLRSEWEATQAAALQLAEDGKEADAIKTVQAYLQRLARLRILDPACGSGNFLYVTLELLKRLEGEVLNLLRDLGDTQHSLELTDVMVTPANLLGLEVNPRAAAIAELVLWIGFLQWQLRQQGDLKQLPEPIIRNLNNIECRDAVLTWSERTPQLNAQGQPVTRWDGRTTKPHPVTGEEVPDPEARVQAFQYHKPQAAEWPACDYIVGNPPFLGKGERMRSALGDGYIEALRKAYPQVPGSADFVMYWWFKAGELARKGQIRRFGFITTNSISQTFNRRVIAYHLDQKKPLSLVFAIPDHPWVDSTDGAAVRIAMTVGEKGKVAGLLRTVMNEYVGKSGEVEVNLLKEAGAIFSDLSIGANVSGAKSLKFAENLHSNGMMIRGSGFIIDFEQAEKLGLGRINGLEKFVRKYLNGRDVTQKSRGKYVIDLFGLELDEIRETFPEIFQWIIDRVKPERDASIDKGFREKWWQFGRTRPMLRNALRGLDRYIITPETAKHRFFAFAAVDIVPDHMLIAIASDDAFHLGVLSSRIHVIWALAAGGRLGVGNDPRYNKSRCLDPFPFPAPTESQQAQIRELGERLDAHRKRQQAQHPNLTMTDMYNVLEQERAGEPLDEKARRIHEQGLVGILRQLHEELDAAVAAAYGWPADLSEDEILHRLVALNAERAAEEAQGHIRWLRPTYQAPNLAGASQGRQGTLDIASPSLDPATVATVTAQRPWPQALPAQAAALRDLLVSLPAPADLKTLAAAFEGHRTAKRLAEIERLLETLAALGQAEQTDGKWG